MFKFGIEQKVFDIAGIKIGGQPGQHRTVMIGSIFYHKDRIIKNEKTGEFDKEKAEELLRMEEEISEKTGNPRIVDVCCSEPQTFDKFIDFVAKTINGPFAIDGATSEVRTFGAKYVAEVGLSERVVYNSIMPETTEAEISAIRDAKIKSAIFLALNFRNPTIGGRMDVIDGLIGKANMAGIKNILIDATVMDVLDPGPVAKTVYFIKEKYGLPTGCSAYNAVHMWRKRQRLSPETHPAVNVVANLLPITMGANFTLYGPIDGASELYVPCAFLDACIAYTMRQERMLDS